MSSPVIPVGDCCSSCGCPSDYNVPGPQGPAGTPGAQGLNGIDAVTTVYVPEGETAPVMPASGANVDIQVANNAWMVIGQPVYVQLMGSTTFQAGLFRVIGFPLTGWVTLQNTGVSENAAPGTSFVNGEKIAPAGYKGTAVGAVGSFRGGTIAISPSSNSVVLTGAAFGSVPTSVNVCVGMPLDGMHFFATVDLSTISAEGFTAYLSGNTPATGSYTLEYVVILP